MGSGLAAQFGYEEEAEYGTRITPTNFLEFTSESCGLNIARIESRALRAGTRVQRSDRWVSGAHDAQIGVELQLQSKGMGMIFKHLLGTSATSQPGGATLTYEHKSKIADPLGLGLTLQFGKPSSDGTVRPFDYPGTKFTGATFKAAVDEACSLSLSGFATDELSDQTLAEATYASGLEVLSWQNTTLEIGGTAYDCSALTVDIKHAFKTNRFNLGAVTRNEPLVNDFTEITGDITSEFIDLVGYNRFKNGTTGALVATFEGGVIETTYHYAVEITLAYVRFDGESPKVAGPDVLEQPIKWKALDDGTTDSPIAIVYRTTDATI